MKVKRLIAAFAAIVAMGTAPWAQNIPAFPGAEGFGKFATGGRGGEIYHVTNLNDSGTGSLRDAVSKSNRIVVFDVSGVITLKSALIFKPNITVLGQTAPGEGVQVYGNRVSFSGANNIILRYLRIRMGVNGPDGKDCAGIAYGGNMIFDHMSVLWGRDENFSVNWDTSKTDQEPHSITIQNSIIGQGLQSHSCGGLIQTNGGVTLYRNLYIENKTRNPKVKGLNQFVNNVVYNWGDGGAYIMGDTEAKSWADIRGNYFIRGPWNGATQPFTRGTSAFQYFGEDNWYDANKDGALNGALLTTEAEYSNSNRQASLDALRQLVTAQNTNSNAVPHYEIDGLLTAEEAVAWILDNVGPVLPVRDEVDRYLIDELSSFGTDGTTGGISTEMVLPHQGTGTLYRGYKPLDSDNDGIPDEWETANGLNPNDPSDAAAIAENGYANIENYSFSITAAYPYIKHPTFLKAVAINNSAITMTWDDNADDEDGYIIEVSTDNANFTEFARTGADATEFTASALTPDTKYYFRVAAFNSAVPRSVPSPVLQTMTATPSAPEACSAPSPATGAELGALADVVLGWQNATENNFGTVTYTVLLGESADALEVVKSGITDKQLKIGKLTVDKTYSWRVDASNDMGTTTGDVWTFTMVPGGVIFYTNFDDLPEEWGTSAWGTAIAGSNSNVLAASSNNREVEFGSMVLGGTGRLVAMGQNNNSTSGDYSPASSAHAGASNRAIQFYSANSNYVTVSDITGPATITIYACDPNGANGKFNLSAITDTNGDDEINADDQKELLQTFTCATKKRMYKCVYTYNHAVPFTIRIDGTTDKFNFNDIRVEGYTGPDADTGICDLVVGTMQAEVIGSTLIIDGLEPGRKARVHDISGRLVATVVSEGQPVSIDLPSGVYLLNSPGMRTLKAVVR